MPIKSEMREFYPSDWRQISQRLRFERAAGMCQGCGRPHGLVIRCLPDGRWFDLMETAQIRQTRVVLAAAHLDHDPRNNRFRNLRSLYQRCHMIHDRPYHLAQRRITYLLRRALGDLFLGPIQSASGLRNHPISRECLIDEHLPRSEMTLDRLHAKTDQRSSSQCAKSRGDHDERGLGC